MVNLLLPGLSLIPLLLVIAPGYSPRTISLSLSEDYVGFSEGLSREDQMLLFRPKLFTPPGTKNLTGLMLT